MRPSTTWELALLIINSSLLWNFLTPIALFSASTLPTFTLQPSVRFYGGWGGISYGKYVISTVFSVIFLNPTYLWLLSRGARNIPECCTICFIETSGKVNEMCYLLLLIALSLFQNSSRWKLVISSPCRVDICNDSVWAVHSGALKSLLQDNPIWLNISHEPR